MKKLEKIALENSSQELATFTHGVLFGLHTLGFYYNLRRGRLKSALVHGAIAVYDATSLYRHAKYLQEENFIVRLRESGL